MVFNRKTYSHCEEKIPHKFGDRFIPRRYAFGNTELIRNRALNKNKSNEEDIIQMRLKSGYWKGFNYGVYMSELFDLRPKRIYQFNDKYLIHNINSKFVLNPPVKNVTYINNNREKLDWQCKPRAKPSACVDSTHDLPAFKLHSSKKIIDWSYKDQIGASFGQDLVIWTCETDKTVVYRTKFVTALRFSPKGESLALGCEKFQKPLIQIWSMKNTNSTTNDLCLKDSFILSEQQQEIVCIEWHPQGIYILCGMSTGQIYVVNSLTSKTNVIHYHSHRISDIKFNIGAKYLGTSDHHGLVVIMKWPSFKIQLRLKSNTISNPSKAFIDWHPWNPIDIAVAKSHSILIVNIQTRSIVAQYNRRDNDCVIDAIAFNKISAELVVSYCIKNPDGCITFEILIMASFDRIIDVLKIHEDRVHFLLFSPDGRQLATAGDDDMLSIFNFFTQPNRNGKSTHSKSSTSNLTRQSEIFKTLIR
ncbi:protein cortex isoform X2 [Condylostylus longicornis]|uniref:protein cortex isoform X2 n=1 Tax=Condylostylus longicornis TaxID=2530218 RepID=UPI00244DE820|nr:protein cortex isoform X2 [Condylostylus longicornis]